MQALESGGDGRDNTSIEIDQTDNICHIEFADVLPACGFPAALREAKLSFSGNLLMENRNGLIRTAEGYMAELVPEKGDTFLLVENHCPICAAAKVCRGFCTTEQDLFRAVLGENVTVERVEHIVAGDRRCAYRISVTREHAK